MTNLEKHHLRNTLWRGIIQGIDKDDLIKRAVKLGYKKSTVKKYYKALK